MKTLTLIIIALFQLTNACHLKRHSTIQHTTDFPFSKEELHRLTYKIIAKLQHLAIVIDSAESFSYWDHVTYDRVMVDHFQKETPGLGLYLSIFFDYSDIEIAFVKQTSEGSEVLRSSTFTFFQPNQQKPSNPHQQKTHKISSRKFPVNIPEVSASDLPEVPSFEHLQSLHSNSRHDSGVNECKRRNIYNQDDVDVITIQDSDQYVNISATNVKLEDTSAVPTGTLPTHKQDSTVPSSLALPRTSTPADRPSIPANETEPVSRNEILSPSEELSLFDFLISTAVKKFIGTSCHRYKTFISYAPRCSCDSHSVYLKLANSKNLNLNVVYCIDIAIASLIASMQQNPKITVHFYAGKDPVSAYLDANQTISHIRWNEFESLSLLVTKNDINFCKEHNCTIKNMQHFTSPSSILQFTVYYLQRNHSSIYELVKYHLTYSMLCEIVNNPKVRNYHIMYLKLSKPLAETLYRTISDIFVRAAQCFATMIVATAEISLKSNNNSVHVSVNGWIYENNQYLADRISYWVKELNPVANIEIVRGGSRKGFKCLAPVMASSAVSKKYLAQRRVSVF